MKLSKIKPNSIIELNGITYKWNGKELFHYLPWKNGNGVSEYPVLLGGIGWKEIMSEDWKYTYKTNYPFKLMLFSMGFLFFIYTFSLIGNLIVLFLIKGTLEIISTGIFAFIALYCCNASFDLLKEEVKFYNGYYKLFKKLQIIFESFTNIKI